ncbi:exodeoxyribonuclease VII large subunit [Endomicrobium proavitum]|uniref:Exodeoxyribonuclease 7 large subunit n=1 Tax=Endomicrobium proavitum TaxID=1408281 RepID=A0A0G3WI97_9BACT|nr:exodeoxyribonuclease VII large subunit [Endomicrobium proavitum]AKL97592.1 Exodeoxyribonuclease 7 large subunit [Endomicrobium proavitum]
MSEELELNFNCANEEEGRLIYTVSQISAEIKQILENSYPGVWLRGEISNFKLYNSGHMYFNIKDENAQIKAVMFAGSNVSLTFAPEDGMQVLVFGRVSSYPVRGDYQIIVSNMEQAGQGALFEAYEKLKKKLEAEGLFDEASKKEIPQIVNKIGVVTSQDGAALCDILKVLEDLNACAQVLIYPVRVQGKEAEKEIPEAIEYLNKNYKDLDVLLVGRGGGSMEDLWAFNTEPVARAIFASKIPVVSCVGHEIDFSIADFVADKRAPTPSAAAEMVVRQKSELKNKLENLRVALSSNIELVFNDNRARLETLAASRAFTKPHLIYEDKIAYVDELDGQLRHSFKHLLNLKETILKNVSHKLDIVSPLSVLKRGFAICKNEKGEIIKSSVQTSVGEVVNIKLFQGSISAEVKNND